MVRIGIRAFFLGDGEKKIDEDSGIEGPYYGPLCIIKTLFLKNNRKIAIALNR